MELQKASRVGALEIKVEKGLGFQQSASQSNQIRRWKFWFPKA